MPSFQAICTAIHDTLEAVIVPAPFNIFYDWDELPEGMNSVPALEIYVEEWETSTESETDRITFAAGGSGPRRWANIAIRIDLYARQRSQLDEDWELALSLANSLHDALEAQGPCPNFGLAGIRHFRWTARRVVFERSQATYTGYRFELTVGVF